MDGTPRMKQSKAHTAGAVCRRSFPFWGVSRRNEETKRYTRQKREECNDALHFQHSFLPTFSSPLISSLISASFCRFPLPFSSRSIFFFYFFRLDPTLFWFLSNLLDYFFYFDSECTSCATYSPIAGLAVKPGLSIPIKFKKLGNPLLTSCRITQSLTPVSLSPCNFA